MPASKYEKYFVKKPAYEVVPTMEVAGRVPAMTLMSSNLVPGVKTYVETGWVLAMPDPNPHIFGYSRFHFIIKFTAPDKPDIVKCYCLNDSGTWELLFTG